MSAAAKRIKSRPRCMPGRPIPLLMSHRPTHVASTYSCRIDTDRRARLIADRSHRDCGTVRLKWIGSFGGLGLHDGQDRSGIQVQTLLSPLHPGIRIEYTKLAA
jgi:hypothetical protein